MSLDRKSIVYIGVFVALCSLGFFSPELHKHLPRMAAQLVKLSLFLGLIALLGYAKMRMR
jgi:hypothetical protein